MKVIGAGFMRTGTLSTQAALKILGFPCYHMREVARTPGHVEAWTRFVTKTAPMDWVALFRGYEATVDFPAAWYYRELMEAYPDAVVLLNERDPDAWYRSFATLWGFVNKMRAFRFVPKLRRFIAFGDALLDATFDGKIEEANCKRVFEQHNAAVRRHVPPDKLLVFRVTDGWEPLCAFLGCEVPAVPFPHLNEGEQTLQEMAREVFLGPWFRRVAAAAALGLVALGIVWLY